jgi:hypothetical protein
MKEFADEVNSIGDEYRPTSQNSNPFAGGALQRGGFLGPGNAFPEKFDHQLVFDLCSILLVRRDSILPRPRF